MPEELTVKNLFLKWKELKIIECDDFEESKFDWQRIAVVDYKGKLYYVVINSGIASKVIPLEDMPFKYYNGKIYEADTDTKIDNVIDTLKLISEENAPKNKLKKLKKNKKNFDKTIDK